MNDWWSVGMKLYAQIGDLSMWNHTSIVQLYNIRFNRKKSNVCTKLLFVPSTRVPARPFEPFESLFDTHHAHLVSRSTAFSPNSHLTLIHSHHDECLSTIFTIS